MYRILFIDEDREAADAFKTYLDKLAVEDVLHVEVLLPEPTLAECLEMIFSRRPDAVVADFQLNELKDQVKYTVPYTGIEIVESILAQREAFPCIVMTSFDDHAIKASSDVNLVYQKEIFHRRQDASQEKASFAERIIQQMEHYKARITNAEREFNSLVDLGKTTRLNAVEESRLMELDSFLERATQAHMSIPDSLKDASLKADLHRFIESTDKLLEKLNAR